MKICSTSPAIRETRIKTTTYWGAWVALSVKRLTSAQVMFSWFVSSSPMLGSVLTAWSLEPASDSLSPSLCPFPTLALPLKNKLGVPGWRSQLSVRLQPGHDLTVREFEPRVGLCADCSEPGACFRFCVSLSLCPSPAHALSLCLSVSLSQK